MATVHFGRLVGAVGFSRTVAIKRLHAAVAEDPEFVSMFVDEARVAARVRHPNVVPTLDVVATQGELFLVLEYVHGETLAQVLRRLARTGESIPLPIVTAIFSGVLHGLHAAHEARSERGEPLEIVHRDVSPQNILIGVDGAPRVLDFGVAKAVGRVQTTRAGQFKGKLAYMAPEQLVAGQATRQSDIYAVAVCLWEALTGARLFEGEMDGAVLHKILAAKPPPPSARAPGVPAALDAIVLRGLAADPSARFATAREMASAIEEALPMAVPAVVGAWTERVAAESLAQRAATLAEIDRASSAADAATAPARPPKTAPKAESDPPSLWATPSQPRTQFASMFETEPQRVPRGRAALVIGGVGLVAAALAAITIAGVRTFGANATPGAASVAAAQAPPPSPSPAPPPSPSPSPSPPPSASSAHDDHPSVAGTPAAVLGTAHPSRPPAPPRAEPAKRPPPPPPAPPKSPSPPPPAPPKSPIMFTSPG